MADPAACVQPAFSWRTRVYWEDTDAGGVVYHARYLCFLERARTEWMRAFGMGQQALRETHGVVFVVRDLEIAYHQPARLDDELEATVRIERVRSASMELAQAVRRAADHAAFAHARVRLACLNALAWVPCRIPPTIATLIKQGLTQA